MMVDIDTLRQRIWTFLMDPGGLVWDANSLDEAIRLALGDMQRISDNKLAISGLDGESITLLDDGMGEVLVKGAAAYALEMRIVDRADSFELQQTGLDMAGWVEKEKHAYWTEVEKLRKYSFQRSNNVPYFTIPDPDGY